MFGGFFLLFGAAISFAFLDARMFNDSKIDKNPSRTQGVVVDIRETGASINESDVLEYAYEYETPSQESVTSFSYSHYHSYQVGDTVQVEYAPENPYMSRIQDMTTTEMGLAGLFVLIFPLVGLGLFLGGVYSVVQTAKTRKNMPKQPLRGGSARGPKRGA